MSEGAQEVGSVKAGGKLEPRTNCCCQGKELLPMRPCQEQKAKQERTSLFSLLHPPSSITIGQASSPRIQFAESQHHRTEGPI